MTDQDADDELLNREIVQLEQQLNDARAKLKSRRVHDAPAAAASAPLPAATLSAIPPIDLHSLLLLSDSALPLGSFAFSSGLESYLAHHPRSPRTTTSMTTTTMTTSPPSFHYFLSLSLSTLASTTLPYLRTAHSTPAALPSLDNDLDASTACTVARRASIAQGRALVGVWERSLRAQSGRGKGGGGGEEAWDALEGFARELKGQAAAADDEVDVWAPNGHLPPLMGVLCRVLGIALEHAMYMYLLNHAKTLLSAGVRASVLGPYQAQGILASEGLKSSIWGLVEADLKDRKGVDEAGQSVPVMDLWGGRHEIIYSRIFNS